MLVEVGWGEGVAVGKAPKLITIATLPLHGLTIEPAEGSCEIIEPRLIFALRNVSMIDTVGEFMVGG